MEPLPSLATLVEQPLYFAGIFNQQPRRKRRGTVLNVSHCVFYKVVAVGFNTLCYDAERRGIKPSARIKYLVRLPNLNAY